MPKPKFGNTDNEITFETIYGPFIMRRPSMLLTIEMHKESARMMGGVANVDALGELYTLMMAQATVYARSDDQIRRTALNEKPLGWPEGFGWATAYDEDFLPDLIKRFNEWRESFRKPRQPDADQTGSLGGGADAAVRAPSEVQLGSDRSASAGDDGSGDTP